MEHYIRPREEVQQKKEVDKLLTAEFIKRAHYPNSLARVVLVKKSKRNWDVCVDYNDLNKLCERLLPTHSNRSTCQFSLWAQLLNFINVFYGYSQIKTSSDDEMGTSFITDSRDLLLPHDVFQSNEH